MTNTLTETEAKARLDAFIDRQIEARPVEKQILTKLWKALDKAGNPIVSVSGWHNEDDEKVSSLREFFVQAFNLDEMVAHCKAGNGVALVMGQDYDMIADYSVSLEDALKPVNDWLESKW